MGEAAEFEGWEWYLEDAHLIHSPDEPKPWFKPKYVTRTEKDVPLRTPEQEIDLMNEQLLAYEGFDIDYTQFRCLFNYHPVDFNAKEFVEEPETNLDLLNRLCLKSLEGYNQEYMTEYEFVKPLYANFHMSAGVMLLITFLVKDPAHDNLTKEFQARVHYSFHYDTNFVFCRPKPPLQLVSTDEDSLGDAEKDRSTDEDSLGDAEKDRSTDEDSLGDAEKDPSTDEDSLGDAEKDPKKPRLD